jgi:hypothetical protein
MQERTPYLASIIGALISGLAITAIQFAYHKEYSHLQILKTYTEVIYRAGAAGSLLLISGISYIVIRSLFRPTDDQKKHRGVLVTTAISITAIVFTGSVMVPTFLPFTQSLMSIPIMLLGPLSPLVTTRNQLHYGSAIFIVACILAFVIIVRQYMRLPSNFNRRLTCFAITFWTLLGISGVICILT